MRFEDQEKINEFGKLNNRLLEVRAEITQHKTGTSNFYLTWLYLLEVSNAYRMHFFLTLTQSTQSTQSTTKLDAEKLEDANAELMMASGDKVMLLIGQCFLEVDEDYANSYCETKQLKLEDAVKTLSEEESVIVQRQKELKKDLYGRFKDSINLEN